MRIIALRHGESEFNLRRLCNDDPSRAVDLTARGVEQAQAAALRLQGKGIEVVYASPLLRALRTAEIVAESLGLTVNAEPRLGDIRSGCDGHPVDDYLAAIAHDPVEARVNGGESLRDYGRRVHGVLAELKARDHGLPLLVAHEETLRMIHAWCANSELSEVAGLPFPNAFPMTFDNC